MGAITICGNRTIRRMIATSAIRKGQIAFTMRSMLIRPAPHATFNTVPTGGVSRPITVTIYRKRWYLANIKLDMFISILCVNIANLKSVPIEIFAEILNVFMIVRNIRQNSDVFYIYIAKIDDRIVQESRFMRLVLEIAVAKLACEGIAESDLEALKNNLEEYRRADQTGNYDQTLALDNEFHRLIFVSVDKAWVYNNLKTQMIHFDRLRRLAIGYIADKSENTLKDHEDILYAITRHDAEMAEMLVTRHLTHYQTDLSSLMKEYPDYFVLRKDRTE